MPNQLHFSDAEISLLYDAALFERKRKVNEKIFSHFENIRLSLKDSSLHKQFPFPVGVDVIGGKISQGENYLGCPWVMLDFPKMFNKDAMFAYRTMFWYGHYLSASFLCSGEAANTFLPKLLSALHLLPHQTYFSLNPDPWFHAIEPESSLLVSTLTNQRIVAHVNEFGFFKLSRKWTGTNFHEMGKEVVMQYEMILTALL